MCLAPFLLEEVPVLVPVSPSLAPVGRKPRNGRVVAHEIGDVPVLLNPSNQERNASDWRGAVDHSTSRVIRQIDQHDDFRNHLPWSASACRPVRSQVRISPSLAELIDFRMREIDPQRVT